MVFFVAFRHKGEFGNGIEVAEGNEVAEVNESSDDSVKGIHFNDIEEERDLGNDDGFDLPDLGEAEAILNEQIQNMQRNVGIESERDLPCSSPVKKKRTPHNRGRMGKIDQVNVSGEGSNVNDVDIERVGQGKIKERSHRCHREVKIKRKESSLKYLKIQTTIRRAKVENYKTRLEQATPKTTEE
ncbi:hypothetical protein SESBI_50732 [Sesbania bispinosa]|nr:hypothetical protein SESBI_50732 [Sesbania bispinosa]